MKYRITKEYPLKEKMEQAGIGVRELGRILDIHPSVITRLNKHQFHATEKLTLKIMNYFENNTPNVKGKDGFFKARIHKTS